VRSLPYTRTGDIVLAVNPYQWFTELYSHKTRRLYSEALVWNPVSSSGKKEDPRVHLPPHVYEASCLAYKGLLRQGEDQSILVSGESGAGKTETVKILLGDLASVQKGPTSNSIHARLEAQQDNAIVAKVLDSNPLLEAFGNAQTLRNDNSSRFGKYLQLQFDRTSESDCQLAGSKCEVYLLEKSRVTLHHPEERTYHVFYQLLAASEDTKAAIWSGLADTDNESFVYVGWSDTNTIEGKTDAERFLLTVQALALVGVTGDTLQTLWRAICIVLQLGNLEFAPKSGDEEDASQIASLDELQSLSELMGIDSDKLATALTIRNVEARSEKIQVPLTAEKAKESTDAFGKEIYAKTFLWLVRTINDATCAEKNYENGRTANFGIIGLLDIFGFETFETNRFEQLCINYANEKLQQKFTQDVFRSVQAEYEMEGIELEEITYDDNTDVLDLVEGRMGLLAFLNEECVRPKGSDKTFVYKAHAMNKDNPCFFRDLHAQDCEFGVCHYAGKVTYDATNFVIKNMDNLPSDLQECARLSTNDIVAKSLSNEKMMNPLNAPPVGSPTPNKKKRRPRAGMAAASANSHLLKRRNSNIMAETVWTKFKHQLSNLMEALTETKTRYIRCIKPNTQKLPKLMEHVSTVEQLRCAGVVAAVTISRSAFPNRVEHLVVLERFKLLWPKGDHNQVLKDQSVAPDERVYKAVEILLTIALKDMEFEKGNSNCRAFVMGKTRAYFRAGALEFLEGERLKYLGSYATVLQTQVRRFVVHSKYRKHRHAVIVLQAGFRRHVQKQAYQKIRASAVKIQCWYRIIFAARTIVHLRRMFKATMIQTQWRTRRDSRRFQKLRVATIVVQTMVRGSLQRPKYRQALIDKKEEAKLENQLRSLQRKLEEAEDHRVAAEKEAEERAKAAIEKYKEKEEKAKEEEEKKDEAAKAEEEEKRQREEEEERRKGVEEEYERDHAIQEEQQKLMGESGRMLEYLRKEVFKLRNTNQQLKTDFDLLKDNNQRLMDANASAGASFGALNQHAKQLSKQNTQLFNDTSSYKTQIQKLNLLQVELKDELKMKQATYIAEVQSRLQYQRSLQKIAEMVQESCRDHRLVEKVLQVADECEMEYMTAGEDRYSRGEDEAEAMNGSTRTSGIFGYFFS
jgi:myosin-5